jgi:hypothetical protein
MFRRTDSNNNCDIVRFVILCKHTESCLQEEERREAEWSTVAVTYIWRIWQVSDLNWSLPFRAWEGRFVDIVSVMARNGAQCITTRDRGRDFHCGLTRNRSHLIYVTYTHCFPNVLEVAAPVGNLFLIVHSETIHFVVWLMMIPFSIYCTYLCLF